MITVVDYGIGNLNSVANMIRKVGGKVQIVNDPENIRKVDRIILPGVGAFDKGMEALGASGMTQALNEAVLDRGVMILGICLGMQIMAKNSEEGKLNGLGWINSEVKRFKFSAESQLKIPHMGWNTLCIKKPNRLIPLSEAEQRFYFVHSYHMVCKDESDVLASATYGYNFTAATQHENIWGVQFHPEKSHRFGMTLMKNFVEM